MILLASGQFQRQKMWSVSASESVTSRERTNDVIRVMGGWNGCQGKRCCRECSLKTELEIYRFQGLFTLDASCVASPHPPTCVASAH